MGNKKLGTIHQNAKTGKTYQNINNSYFYLHADFPHICESVAMHIVTKEARRYNRGPAEEAWNSA